MFRWSSASSRDQRCPRVFLQQNFFAYWWSRYALRSRFGLLDRRVVQPITIYQLLHLLTRQLHRIYNMLIPRTAAQIPRKCVADFIFGGIWILFEEWNHAHQNPWRAVAALKSVGFPEGLLQRVKVIVVECETLNRCDGMSIGLDGKRQTRARRFPVEENRARAANAVFTADVSTRQPKFVA